MKNEKVIENDVKNMLMMMEKKLRIKKVLIC